MKKHRYQTVDEYLNQAHQHGKLLASELRSIIRSAIPQAEETISYNMPAYRYQQILIYFGIFPDHLGFYPTPSAIAAFKSQLVNYKFAKGSIQFPLHKKLPAQLITEICQFRFREVAKTKDKKLANNDEK